MGEDVWWGRGVVLRCPWRSVRCHANPWNYPNILRHFGRWEGADIRQFS